jgi:Spy/CpxP family protein refolding chaperone
MRLNLAARTQAIVLLALVATSGALAGVVGDRLLSDRGSASVAADMEWTARPGPAPGMGAGAGAGPWRFEARPGERYGERLASSLELSAEQRAAIDSIVMSEQQRVRELTAEVQPRFRAIAAETRLRIEDVLTPEQRERLRGLRQERMRGMLRERLFDDDRMRGTRPGVRPGMPEARGRMDAGERVPGRQAP